MRFLIEAFIILALILTGWNISFKERIESVFPGDESGGADAAQQEPAAPEAQPRVAATTEPAPGSAPVVPATPPPARPANTQPEWMWKPTKLDRNYQPGKDR